MQREFEFRKRFVAVTVSSIVYVVVALSLAVLGAGVWSIVIGQITATAASGAALLALAPYRVRPVFDRDEARESLAAGRGFLLQGGLAFLQQNADYISVGRVLGAAQLGFYSMAYRIGELPYYAIADPVARVTFPSFARMRHEGEEVAMPFLSALRMVALVTCPLGIVLSAAAEPFTAILFGDKWLPMVGPLSVLGIWAAVRPVQVTIGWLLNSVGAAGLMGVISALVLLAMLPGLVVAAELGGITAVAWVMLADITLSLLVLGFVAERRAGVPMVSQWRALSPIVVGCAGTWGVASAVVRAMSDASPGLALAGSALTALATYVATISILDPGLLRHAFAQVGRALGKLPAPATGSR
jgi:O-antigen/teichoic acid export membrane protein